MARRSSTLQDSGSGYPGEGICPRRTALDAVFKGEREFKPAMSEYQKARDADTAGAYQFNHAFSALKVTPRLCQMLVSAAEARAKAAADG